jgi:hypothetical protein
MQNHQQNPRISRIVPQRNADKGNVTIPAKIPALASSGAKIAKRKSLAHQAAV